MTERRKMLVMLDIVCLERVWSMCMCAEHVWSVCGACVCVLEGSRTWMREEGSGRSRTAPRRWAPAPPPRVAASTSAEAMWLVDGPAAPGGGEVGTPSTRWWGWMR